VVEISSVKDEANAIVFWNIAIDKRPQSLIYYTRLIVTVDQDARNTKRRFSV
jgi:hypothetical protein